MNLRTYKLFKDLRCINLVIISVLDYKILQEVKLKILEKIIKQGSANR